MHLNVYQCIQFLHNYKLEMASCTNQLTSLFIDSGIINYREIIPIVDPQFPKIGGDALTYFMHQLAEGAVPINSRLYDFYIPSPNPQNMIEGYIYYCDLFYGSTLDGKFEVLFKSPSWIHLASEVGMEPWSSYKTIVERLCNYFLFSQNTIDIQIR